MQNPPDPNKPEPPQPPTAEIIDFSLPSSECCFEIENLPGPDEFEELHGYSIEDDLES